MLVSEMKKVSGWPTVAGLGKAVLEKVGGAGATCEWAEGTITNNPAAMVAAIKSFTLRGNALPLKRLLETILKSLSPSLAGASGRGSHQQKPHCLTLLNQP